MSAKKKSAGASAKRAKPRKAPKSRPGATKPKARVAAKKPAAKKLAAKRPAAKKLATKKPVAKKLVAKKPVAKKLVAAKKPAAKKLVATEISPKHHSNSKPAAKPTAVKRRDGAGHLDPKYAAELRALSNENPKDDNRAFGGDALSEELGEEFVETVTSGEDEGTEVRDQRVTEELGGPFTVTSGGTEFARDVDGSNPKGATREPFPRT
jgi:hypothetical protein